MTPNLTRLFAEVYAYRDDMTDEEISHVRDRMKQLQDIFETHGEALIKVLETLVDGCDTPADYDVAYHAAKQLLAQLESEAQP